MVWIALWSHQWVYNGDIHYLNKTPYLGVNITLSFKTHITDTIISAIIITALYSHWKLSIKGFQRALRCLLTSFCLWRKLRQAEICSLLKANKQKNSALVKTILPSNNRGVYKQCLGMISWNVQKLKRWHTEAPK